MSAGIANVAIFILSGDAWLQLTEAVSIQEAKEYMMYYQHWFSGDKFRMEAAQG